MEVHIPTSLRDEVAQTILARFKETYEKHGVDYDPDTCHEAADDVCALLASRMLGRKVIPIRIPNVIGTVGFQIDNEDDGHGFVP